MKRILEKLGSIYIYNTHTINALLQPPKNQPGYLWLRILMACKSPRHSTFLPISYGWGAGTWWNMVEPATDQEISSDFTFIDPDNSPYEILMQSMWQGLSLWMVGSQGPWHIFGSVGRPSRSRPRGGESSSTWRCLFLPGQHSLVLSPHVRGKST